MINWNDLPSVSDEVSTRQAEEIVKTWRCMDISDKREEIKARLQLAIAIAITNEITFTTMREMRGAKEGK